MDVEQIQKINNLAVDLMKQGLASDRDEAIAQAEKIFQGGSSEYNSIKDGLAQSAPEPVAQEVVDLSQDKIKDILEQNTKFLVKKITEFQDQLNSLQKEISGMKSKIAYNSIPSAKEILTKDAVKEPEPAPKADVEEAPEEKDKENHPLYGGYNDTDVSIEKFFYMGGK